MDRLDAMRLFVAVAKQGSFAGASRRLRISPSVATRGIAQLEDALGVSLFTRTTRSLHLTEPGELYLDSCQRILQDVDDAERHARGENAEPWGELSIAAPLLFGRLHVLPLVNHVLAQYPAVSIRLNLSDRNTNLVEEGIDIAVRIGPLADSSLVALKLGEVSRVVTASPAYLARRGRPLAPADLAGHDIIVFDSVGSGSEWQFAEYDKPVRIEPRLAVNSADAAIAAAEAGVGITRTLSYQVEGPVRAGRLVPLLMAYSPHAVPISAIYPPRRIASPNVAMFVKEARRHFATHPVSPVEEWLLPQQQ